MSQERNNLKKILTVVIIVALTLATLSVLSTSIVRADTSEAKVLSYSWYVAPANPVLSQYGGDLAAVGEIQNVGSNVLSYVYISGAAYDSSGALLCASESQAYVYDMLPGQKAPFYLDFNPANSATGDQSWVPSVTNVTVSVVSVEESNQPQNTGLQIPAGSISAALDSKGTYTLTGTVQNVGTQASGQVWVVSTFYDALGTVIGLNYTNYLSNSLSPGEAVSFTATPVDNTAQLSSKIAKYSLLVQYLTLTPSPSPTPSPTPTSVVTPSPIPTPTAPTSTPTPTPTLKSPSLSFDCISSTTYSGFNVEIQGLLAYNGVGIPDAGIQFSYSVTGGATWQDLTYVNTDNNGNFTCTWNPSVSGNYVIEAMWSGDGDYSGASAVYNFAVAPFNNQNQNVFSVTSNSTLTSLAFDSTTNDLSFGVSGPSGTTGFTEVCIPQSLIPDISKLNVTLDGASINHNSNSENNVWLITFTYHHSSHIIDIALAAPTTPVPEFPTWIILPLFAISTLLSIVLIRRRIPKK